MPKLNRDNMQEFICEIIEHFEDFLDAKGIELDNPEKREAIAAREDVWHWFDEKYPGGVKKLMKLEDGK